MATQQTWETYEEVAQHLLAESRDHFGLAEVEGKQSVPGLISQTDWEIDAKGVMAETDQFVIIECRRYTTKGLNQEALGGLAWRIHDTGAAGGIIVSPLPLQEGAEKVAKAAGVVHVRLNAEATTSEYLMQFLDRVRIGLMDQASLNISEHLAIRIYDRNGELLQEEVITDELTKPSVESPNEGAMSESDGAEDPDSKT